MAEALKLIYNKAFFEQLTKSLQETLPAFDKKAFLKAIYDKQWEQRELKDRMKHIASVMHQFLSKDFAKDVKTLFTLIDRLRQNGARESSFEYMFLPEYVEAYGIDHPDLSIQAFERITPFTSCEFAVRPFIKKYPERMMAQMLAWSTHKNEHVRRFASEGCRPRLPWAMALPALKKNPKAIFPILENLKQDPSEYVRRSVANNLNDIIKDHPDVVLQLAQQWTGKHEHTDGILKHGTRTLLKQGHVEALSLFGFSADTNCEVLQFKLAAKQLKIGEHLHFSFQLRNNHKKNLKLRLEYRIYYVKSSGKQSSKIFKITENHFTTGEVYSFQRKQSFQDMTTRKHYPGVHKICLVVNGSEVCSKTFKVIP